MLLSFGVLGGYSGSQSLKGHLFSVSSPGPTYSMLLDYAGWLKLSMATNGHRSLLSCAILPAVCVLWLFLYSCCCCGHVGGSSYKTVVSYNELAVSSWWWVPHWNLHKSNCLVWVHEAVQYFGWDFLLDYWELTWEMVTDLQNGPFSYIACNIFFGVVVSLWEMFPWAYKNFV